MSILGFIFFLLIFLLLFAFAFVAVFFVRIWNFVRVLMGKEPLKPGNNGFYHTQWGNGSQQWGGGQQWGGQQQTGSQQTGSQQTGANTQQNASRTTISGTVKPRSSEIDKNEGEYVDFEEV